MPSGTYFCLELERFRTNFDHSTQTCRNHNVVDLHWVNVKLAYKHRSGRS